MKFLIEVMGVMSVLITISHPLSRLASSIVLAQVRSES